MPNPRGQAAFQKILKESNLHENVVISFMQVLGRVDLTQEEFDSALEYAESLKIPNPDNAGQVPEAKPASAPAASDKK